jgi:hypothetical protein
MDDNQFANDKQNNEIIIQTSNLDKISGDSVPVEMVENIVREFAVKLTEMSKNIEEKNTFIGDKLANMITLANFEGKLIELMLQNRYFMDARGKKVYEQIKEDAKDITLNSLGKLSDTNNLKLYEDILAARTEIAELQEAVNEGKQREEELQKSCASLRAENKQCIDRINAYGKLVEWYEKFEREVPEIRKKNSGIIRTQTWESAITDFKYYNQKPAVPEINITGSVINFV